MSDNNAETNILHTYISMKMRCRKKHIQRHIVVLLTLLHVQVCTYVSACMYSLKFLKLHVHTVYIFIARELYIFNGNILTKSYCGN